MKVFFWDGDKESLRSVLQQDANTDIVQIREGWSRERCKASDAIIAEWGLRVYSYPPMCKVGDKWRFKVGNSHLDIKIDGEPTTTMGVSPFDWTEIVSI